MRNPAFVVFAICLVLLTNCGRDYTQQAMTSDEATDTLSTFSQESARGVIGKNNVSVQGLNELILSLVKSGKVPQKNGHGAIATNVDLTVLNQLLSMFQSSNGKPSFLAIAGMIANLNGGAAQASNKLQGILDLLISLAPMIASIAPQYTAIIAAITTVVPLVMSFFQLFKRPKKAAAFSWQPVTA